MGYGNAGDAIEKGGDATLIGEDYRGADGDGFRGCVTEIFVLGGKDEEVGVTVGGPFGVTGERAGEMNARGKV